MFSRCLATSRWTLSGTPPTLVNKVCNMLSSSVNCSTRFCSRSLSLTNNLTFSSVSLERNFAFSRDFLTAILLRSRRRRYSSVPLSARLLPPDPLAPPPPIPLRLEDEDSLTDDETLLTDPGLLMLLAPRSLLLLLLCPLLVDGYCPP